MWRKSIVAAGVGTLLLVASLGIWIWDSRSYGVVTVINDSAEEFSASVLVCSQNFEVPNLLPGEKQRIRFALRADSGYFVKVKFKSGRELDKEVGYVTNGMPADDEVHIRSGDIEDVPRTR